MLDHLKKGVAALAVAAVTVATPAIASAQTAASDVYVVHGIPGLPVDVFVNNEKTLTNFTPKSVAGPLELPAGSYEIEICPTSASTTPCATPAISVPNAQVPANGNVSLVAHLDASANPTLTPFVNDVSAADAGEGRLVVRHTAAAPAVDLLAAGTKIAGPLSNPNEFKTDLAAATVEAQVVAAGTTTPAVFDGDVSVEAGKATIVYAIGNLTATPSTFDVVTQSIGLEPSSVTVHSGTAGLQGAHDSVAWTWFAVVGLGLVGVSAFAAKRLLPATVNK